MDVNDIINRLKYIENSASELSIRLGIGESIETIVQNIKEDRIKTEYIELINYITEYCVKYIDNIEDSKIQTFIHKNKRDDTHKILIQPLIDRYENNKLDLKHRVIIKKLFGNDNFTSNIDVSLEIAIITHVYMGNKITNLRKYKISENLEARLYTIAIAMYGIHFIYDNTTEISKFSSNIKHYPRIINSMIRQGLDYDEQTDTISKLNVLFKDIIREKTQDTYRQFIIDRYKSTYDKIIIALTNLDNLKGANFDRRRFDFWKDYILLGKFKMWQSSDLLTIKFEKQFIIEQGGWQGGFAYILDNSRYNAVVKEIGWWGYETSEIKHYLNNLYSNSKYSTEDRCRHVNNWENNLSKKLNDRNIYTDKSKMILHNREKEERRKMTPQLRYKILYRDKYTCKYCGKLLIDEKFHIDHMLPVSRGGHTEESNLVAACVECNLSKGAKTAEEFMSRKLKYVPIDYHKTYVEEDDDTLDTSDF